MGLVFQGTKVLIDHASKEHLVTTVAGNPKRYKVENEHGDLDVFSIFTRLKATSRERRNRSVRLIGDNCPMIYALKGKDKLTTGYRSVREMLLVGTQVVQQNFTCAKDTVIVCIPSSHTIVGHLAKQLGKHLQLQVVEGLLSKASVRSAVADIEHAIKLSKDYKERKDLQNILQHVKKQEVFALKDVPPGYRHLIAPVVIGSNLVKSPYTSILLVDDLVSTGSSLITAKNVLRSNKQGKDFTALSLFSKV